MTPGSRKADIIRGVQARGKKICKALRRNTVTPVSMEMRGVTPMYIYAQDAFDYWTLKCSKSCFTYSF